MTMTRIPPGVPAGLVEAMQRLPALDHGPLLEVAAQAATAVAQASASRDPERLRTARILVDEAARRCDPYYTAAGRRWLIETQRRLYAVAREVMPVAEAHALAPAHEPFTGPGRLTKLGRPAPLWWSR